VPLKAGIRGRAAEPLALPVTATRQAHGPARSRATPDLPPFRPPPRRRRSDGHMGGGEERGGFRGSEGTEQRRITVFDDGRPDSAELREKHAGFASSLRPHYEMDGLTGADCLRHADLRPMTDFPSRAKQTESNDDNGSADATASTAWGTATPRGVSRRVLSWSHQFAAVRSA
jgi:hypothetical protein